MNISNLERIKISKSNALNLSNVHSTLDWDLVVENNTEETKIW
jgi:hypothetical protein